MGDCVYEGRRVDETARELGIEDIVHCLGQVPHHRCLGEIGAADILVLFNIDQPLQVPAKLFEYLSFRKPILSISSGGITDELIAKTRIGLSVPPGDIEAIKGAIVSLIESGGRAGDDDEIGKFSTSAIFGSLASELRDLAESI
jgi:glycosyltransferase involved in cell wall biosynthesis